jgi:hypothetical protein
MSFQNKFDKRDYYAFQALWQDIAHRYIQTTEIDIRYELVNTFRDSLIDIQPNGPRALRSIYEKWEKDIWSVFCEKELERWNESNPFESSDKRAVQDEKEQLLKDYNYMRYKKILQIIQDSGIGLGSSKSIKSVSRKGYNG